MWSNMSHSTIEKAVAEAIHAYQKASQQQTLDHALKAPRLDPENSAQLAAMIDHTLLAPTATADQFEALCHEAVTHGFYSVCVPGSKLPQVTRQLKGTHPTIPIAVIGFPHGTGPSRAKAFEASECVRMGAQEIDMVISVSELKANRLDLVFDDIAQVVDASMGRPVKVILETAFLTDAEKIAACVISKKAGARFVKTSTGYASAGATETDVTLMRFTVGPEFGVKASGGIKSRATALRMIRAGANRLGTSSGVAIVSAQEPSTESKGDY